MRKKLTLGVVLAAAALGVGVYLWHSGYKASAQVVELDRSIVALLPANATTLVGVNVERLKGTPIYRYVEDESRKKDGQSHFDEFSAMTGLDPRRDVDRLLIAAWGNGAARSGTGQTQFVGVARGRFQAANLTQLIKEKKGTVENYRGFEIFSPEEKAAAIPNVQGNQRHEQGAFTFLDDKTALAGSLEAVKAAIDRKVGGGPTLLDNTALLSRAQTISATNQVWAVSQKPGDVMAQALPKEGPAESSNFARVFSSMQNSTFALDFMNGLELHAGGVCQSPQDAKTLADAARGMVAFGRLSASQKDPEMMTLFDGIQIEERGAELGVTVRIDLASFEKLLEKSRSKESRSASLN
ncbi:MAG: hypothetical protein HY236_06545 [Acidobacteria bacterium]|nr:hypothetical protein [Acidobacteriota bacterium]